MNVSEHEKQTIDAAYEWFDSHRQQFVEELADWIRVPSVSRAEEASLNAPFGPEVSRMFDVIKNSSLAHGLEVHNHDGYALSLRLGPHDREIGLISHIDVVPEGEGWTYPPFEPTVIGDYMIGRGTRDNKGSAVLDLCILQFFKEQGWPLRSGLRVILGGAEETGMADMKHYVASEPVPDVSLVTDGFFPVNHEQHGRLAARLLFPFDKRGASWNAGDADNSVPAHAEVRITDPISAREVLAFAAANPMPGVSMRDSGETGLTVEATGVAGHAAFPGQTVNAAGVLVDFIFGSGAFTDNEQDILGFLRDLLTDQFGAKVGLDRIGESGRLTVNGSQLRTNQGRLELAVTMRVPVEFDVDEVAAEFAKTVSDRGGQLEDVTVTPPHIVASDDSTVEKLRRVFDDFTGATTQPMSMGGGTHARIVPRSHTFGTGLWTEQAIAYAPQRQADFLLPGHGDPHGPDECVSIENLRMAFVILVLAITRLDKDEG